MSYCRWSSDDYQCDAYVWEDYEGGWITMMASRRRIFLPGHELPPKIELPIGDRESFERTTWARAWSARHAIVSAMIDEENEGTVWEWMDLPESERGREYHHDTPGDCAMNLDRLRGMGFNIPRAAIDSLREEQAEMS